MSHEQIWSKEENGTTSIGFTQDFLEEAMGECWHIMPAHKKLARKDSPLLCIETNDGLLSILSPVAGDILTFSSKARDFPDRLKPDDVVMTVGKRAREEVAEPTRVMASDLLATLRRREEERGLRDAMQTFVTLPTVARTRGTNGGHFTFDEDVPVPLSPAAQVNERVRRVDPWTAMHLRQPTPQPAAPALPPHEVLRNGNVISNGLIYVNMDAFQQGIHSRRARPQDRHL